MACITESEKNGYILLKEAGQNTFTNNSSTNETNVFKRLEEQVRLERLKKEQNKSKLFNIIEKEIFSNLSLHVNDDLIKGLIKNDKKYYSITDYTLLANCYHSDEYTNMYNNILKSEKMTLELKKYTDKYHPYVFSVYDDNSYNHLLIRITDSRKECSII